MDIETAVTEAHRRADSLRASTPSSESVTVATDAADACAALRAVMDVVHRAGSHDAISPADVMDAIAGVYGLEHEPVDGVGQRASVDVTWARASELLIHHAWRPWNRQCRCGHRVPPYLHDAHQASILRNHGLLAAGQTAPEGTRDTMGPRAGAPVVHALAS